MKRLFYILIHGKLALAFFLTCALLAVASVPLIDASFIEPALLSSPPETTSIILIADTASNAACVVFHVGGQVIGESTLIDAVAATINQAILYDIGQSPGS